MKSVRFSQISMFAGLTVGLLALWSGAAPVGASGDLVTGSWVPCTTLDLGVYVAATSSDCDPCNGTYTAYCSSRGPGCLGGAVTVIVASQYGATPHSTGSLACIPFWPPGACPFTYDSDCY